MAIANAQPDMTVTSTLLEHALPSSTTGQNTWVRNFIVIIAGSLMLTLSAKISIPFYPVPMTFQTLVVLCLGMALGPRLGAAAVLAYLAQGAMGLPVFAGSPEKGVGIAYMMGPTGGYLAGFVIAAYVTGLLARVGWDRKVSTTVAAMLIGNAVIYLCGLAWLGSVVGWDKPVLAWGLTPFLLGDLVKVLLAAAVLPSLWRFLK